MEHSNDVLNSSEPTFQCFYENRFLSHLYDYGYPQIPGTFPLIPSPDHKYVACTYVNVNNIVNIIGLH